MKIETRIALTYTAVIAGVITLVVIVFYVVAAGYIGKLADSSPTENNIFLDIQYNLGGMLIALVLVCSFLVYFVGRHYAKRMIHRIDIAYQSEKSFVRSASHELNNPLTAIQGECEITLMKERSSEEYQAALSRVLTETKRIIQLMKHLLFLSRGDKDILQNAMEPIFLAEFMMRFVENRVNFSPDHFSFVVNANPHLLKIAIENIISNALKYSDKEPVEMRLRVNELEIEDHGIGIPADELEHIYQPFFRASNTHGYAGHGIGLALSVRILQTYGAKVKIYSALNEGTKVTISFP
ncbi:sensor histidine kinase [Parabacteroides sp. 52]|uniref:sensor histidine kinase n=1 Tax=unclassified Parabacteroides TaxID=2649774 RepID=UPI0013D430A1|nr:MULTISPECIES: HAMP domain-containing sensor histidine kinase [unclassified Parabacteroides]MDH6533584.1 signal transduction histidine kinase [Parabacteroides sp. PM5-20]NDV54336.1 sensor histidine kinase [Parabacteroides sp. 52]